MIAITVVAIGVAFTVVPIAAIYLVLVRSYDGSTTATAFRAFQVCYTVSSIVLVGSTVAIPLGVQGTLGTGPAVFAPLLDVAGQLVLVGLGCFAVALGAYGVAAVGS